MLKNLFSNSSNRIQTIIIAVVAALILLSNTSVQFSASGRDAQTQIFSTVLGYVNKYYIDNSKIEPVDMLKEGLSKLEQIIDEVLIEYSQNSKNFTVQVLDNKKSFSYSGLNNIKDLTDIFDDVFSYIGSNYEPEDKTFIEIEYAVVDALLKTLDSNSGIITPKVYKEFMIETEGSFGGLGIVIGIREGQLTVISPIEGTPAYLAGVKSKDKIVQIEDGSTVNMSLLEAVSKLRGPKGTKVSIYVMRDGFSNPKKFTIKRDTIKIESVDAFSLDENILYLKVRDFQKNTLTSIKEKINKITNDNINSAEGIILDLRGNPGGLLEQSKKISDLFLQSGNIVSTQIGSDKKTYSAKNEFYEYNGKLIVLVDSGSASASEIVAGALKNNNRALVIGERTFGKGSVQQIFNLKDNAALKLTIANYLTPGDISIQDKGITPDIALQAVRISENDVDIIPNEKNNADENGITLNTEAPKSSIKFLEIITDPEEEVVEEALSDKQKLEKLANDVTVQFSKTIIKNSQSPQTLSNINFIAQEISNFSKDQESRITSKLSELEIDWTKSNDANSKNNLKVDIKKSKTVVTAGENIDISMTVKNNGASPVERVYAVTKSDNPVFNDKEYIFGKIAPGQSKTWTNSFEVPKWALSRDDKVEFELRNYDTDGVEKFQLEVSTRQLLRPRFAFNYELVDDGRSETSGNGNGIPEINEVVGLKFKIKNIGSGTSEKATLLLKNNTGEDLYLKKGRVSLENINPNEVKEETFLFSINKHLKELDLDFQILDDTFRDGIVKNIKFSIPDKSNELVLESVLYITNSDTTPIYGNHLDKNSVIATSIKDSAFESVKSMGSWVKVKLNDGSSGWIDIKHLNKSTVTKENNNKPYINHKYQQSPQIYVEQPPLLINTGKISLSGKVDDADGVELITVFVGEDKVYLKNIYNNSSVFSSDISLNEGVNYINIFAKDSGGLTSKKTYVVRYDT